MRRYSLLLASLGLFATLFVCCAPASAQDNARVHFIVVPPQTNDGSDLVVALNELKKTFIELAGGYTELGKTQGGSKDSGAGVNESANYSFIVAANKDLTKELEAYISEHFSGSRPFILTWAAACNLW